MKYAKGIMWLDDCRIPFVDEYGDKKGNKEQKQSGDVYGFSTYKQLYVRAEPNQQGRFTPNLLVCDDLLNDGTITSQGKIKLHRMSGWGDTQKIKKNAVEYQGDKGTNSRYYDLDKWFDKVIDEIR